MSNATKEELQLITNELGSDVGKFVGLEKIDDSYNYVVLTTKGKLIITNHYVDEYRTNSLTNERRKELGSKFFTPIVTWNSEEEKEQIISKIEQAVELAEELEQDILDIGNKFDGMTKEQVSEILNELDIDDLKYWNEKIFLPREKYELSQMTKELIEKKKNQ